MTNSQRYEASRAADGGPSQSRSRDTKGKRSMSAREISTITRPIADPKRLVMRKPDKGKEGRHTSSPRAWWFQRRSIFPLRRIGKSVQQKRKSKGMPLIASDSGSYRPLQTIDGHALGMCAQ